MALRFPSAAMMLALFFTAAVGRCGDVYVLRFNTGNGAPTGPCDSFSWEDELIFHNTGATETTVQLIGVTNGRVNNPPPMTLAAGSTLAVGGSFAQWMPDSHPTLWVAHLSVPDGVLVTSRAKVHRYVCPCERFRPCVLSYASLIFPVVTSLDSPGAPSYHLGADVGGYDFVPPFTASHINTTIMNGGDAAATAVIEVRNAGDDTLMVRRTVTVPPNTVIQATIDSSEGNPSFSSQSGAAAWEHYVIVTLDQPGFSVVCTLANDQPPFFPASAAP